MNEKDQKTPPSQPSEMPASPQQDDPHSPAKPKEYGGPKGPEPTRYGDWEKAGRCIDF